MMIATTVPPMPMPEPISIDEVNVSTAIEFRQRFGNIIECCPDVAAALSTQRPFINVESMALAANRFLDQLQPQGKERILLLHPDLAGRLAEQGQLTRESSREQKSAGLDSLSSDDKTRMNELNKRYRAKFGFPFVICARDNKVANIFQGLDARLSNSRETELEIGINEVKKICRLRIRELVYDN